MELTEGAQLKPYVSVKVDLTKEEERMAFGRFRGTGGLTPQHFLRVSREHDRFARLGTTAFKTTPSWYNSQKNVNGEVPVPVKASS